MTIERCGLMLFCTAKNESRMDDTEVVPPMEKARFSKFWRDGLCPVRCSLTIIRIAESLLKIHQKHDCIKLRLNLKGKRDIIIMLLPALIISIDC